MGRRRAKRIRIIAGAVFLLGSLLGIASGSEQTKKGVEIQMTQEQPLELKPRQILTLAFRVVNTTKQRYQFIPSLVLPEGWRMVGEEAEFELKPAESSLRLVSLVLPVQALVGSYQIHYGVQAKGFPAVQDRIAVDIQVALVPQIGLRLLNSPQVALAGETYQSDFLVSNESNAPFTILLNAKSTEGYPFECDRNEMRLSPGESGKLTITVKTDAGIIQKYQHHLKVMAAAKELGAETILASAFTSVELIPRESGRGDIYRRLPTKLSFIGFARQGQGQAGQVEYAGLGEFHNKFLQTVDFLFRGPGRRELLSLGLFPEEYRFLLKGRKASLFLGDHVYHLSRLTEYGHYGRGLEGEFSLGLLALKGYYQKSIMGLPDNNEWAFQLGLPSGEDQQFSLHLNFLRNQRIDRPRGQVYSLKTDFHSRPFNAEFELGMGRYDGENSNNNKALALEAYGQISDQLDYRATRIQGDADYPGSYRDIVFNSLEFHLSPLQKLEMRAAYHDFKNNAEKNPSYTANFERYSILGMKYQLSKSFDISCDYRIQDRQALFPVPLFDYRESSVRLGLWPRFRDMNLYGLVEIGRTHSRISGEWRRLLQFELSGDISAFKKLNLSGDLQYRDQDSNFTGDKERSTNARLSLALDLGRTKMVALYRRTHYYEFYERVLSDQALVEEMLLNRTNYFELGVEQNLFRGHSLALRLRGSSLPRGDGGKSKELLVLLEYKVPLGVPLYRNSGEGELAGRVYDAEAENKGLAGVIIKLGGRATVTNERGRYVFHGLEPGPYTLDIERWTIGPSRVPVIQMPLEMDIKGGKKTKFDLEITRGATISGQAVVYGYEENGADPLARFESGSDVKKLEEKGGLADALIELSGESRTDYQITDRNGVFKFEGLQTGKYVLNVIADKLPELHYIENESYPCDLVSGAREDVLVRVLPRERQIRMIGKGEKTIIPGGAGVKVRKEPAGTSQEALRRPAPGTKALAKTPSSSRKKVSPAAPYSIQVGSFLSEQNAHSLKTQLKTKYQSIQVTTWDTADQVFYRVLIPSSNIYEVRRFIRELKQEGFEPFVVRNVS